MATHDISLKVPQGIIVLKKDIEIRVDEDEELLGRVHISKGSIDWRPANAQHARRMSWAKFDALMQMHGKKVQLG